MIGATEIDLLNFLKEGGGYAIAILVVTGFLRGWIVPGWMYREQLEECQTRERKWEEIALRGNQITREAVGTLSDVAKDHK